MHFLSIQFIEPLTNTKTSDPGDMNLTDFLRGIHAHHNHEDYAFSGMDINGCPITSKFSVRASEIVDILVRLGK